MKSKNNGKKYSYFWAVAYGLLLTGYVVYTLLDTFVLPRDLVRIDDIPRQTDETSSSFALFSTSLEELTVTENTADASASEGQATEAETPEATTAAIITQPTDGDPEEPIITDTSYESSSIFIKITNERLDDTEVYIAEVIIKDPGLLKAGLAHDSFGRNLKQYTSAIAASNNAILAVNGDYYGFRESGYVMRNGYLYRTKGRSGEQCDGMAIFNDGHMEVYKEPDIDAQSLADRGAVQIFCFGPALLKDSEILVNENSEVEMSWNDNPRTAIGQISPLHYLFVVSDGRTEESKGLSLNSLARLMKDKGCDTAYNLDGGGSATMWFMGEVVNVPTDGRRYGERGISDIVYIGE